MKLDIFNLYYTVNAISTIFNIAMFFAPLNFTFHFNVRYFLKNKNSAITYFHSKYLASVDICSQQFSQWLRLYAGRNWMASRRAAFKYSWPTHWDSHLADWLESHQWEQASFSWMSENCLSCSVLWLSCWDWLWLRPSALFLIISELQKLTSAGNQAGWNWVRSYCFPLSFLLLFVDVQVHVTLWHLGTALFPEECLGHSLFLSLSTQKLHDAKRGNRVDISQKQRRH